MILENVSQLSDRRRARLKNFARREHLFLLEFQTSGDEVYVTLALTNLGIVNAMHLVRHRQKSFRQKL
ncbi:hypothetical protein D3C83_284040 [compost metagenome]